MRKELTDTKPGPERETVRRRQVPLLSSTFDRAKAVRLARIFRDHRVYLVPTLVANRVFAVPEAVEYDADSRSRYVPRTTIKNWRKRITGFLESRSAEEIRAQKQAYEREFELLRIMSAEGVAIMTGTDADLFAPAGFGLRRNEPAGQRCQAEALRSARSRHTYSGSIYQSTGHLRDYRNRQDRGSRLVGCKPNREYLEHDTNRSSDPEGTIREPRKDREAS